MSGPLVPRLRRSPMAGAVLDGVNVASLALMGVVTWPRALGDRRRDDGPRGARERGVAVSLSRQPNVDRRGRGARRAGVGGDPIDASGASACLDQIRVLRVPRDVRARELARGNDAQLSLARVVQRRADEQAAIALAFVLGPNLGVEDREMIAELAICEDCRVLGAFDHEGLFDHVV